MENLKNSNKEITKVYLNSWYFYNEGGLGFGWMTTDEARAFMEEHENDTRYEEWFIADIDNYCGIDTHDLEYRSIESVLNDIDFMEGLDDDDRKILEAAQEYYGRNGGRTLEEMLEDIQYSHTVYPDKDAYYESCDEIISDYMTMGKVPDFIERYFDYDAYHRDCDFDIYEAKNGVCIAE